MFGFRWFFFSYLAKIQGGDLGQFNRCSSFEVKTVFDEKLAQKSIFPDYVYFNVCWCFGFSYSRVNSSTDRIADRWYGNDSYNCFDLRWTTR